MIDRKIKMQVEGRQVHVTYCVKCVYNSFMSITSRIFPPLPTLLVVA
jgi:hypothetical protein